MEMTLFHLQKKKKKILSRNDAIEESFLFLEEPFSF